MLRDDPFIYFPRSAGARAFEKPLALFEEYGFRPQIVQEASHWLTILSMVGVGLGVSVAPACVRRIAPPEVACIPFRGANVVSTIELARLVGDVPRERVGESRPLVRFPGITSGSGEITSSQSHGLQNCLDGENYGIEGHEREILTSHSVGRKCGLLSSPYAAPGPAHFQHTKLLSEGHLPESFEETP
jgi:hypothetical protein